MSRVHLMMDAEYVFSPLNAELNPICHLLALLGAHRILHLSGIRVKTNPDNGQRQILVCRISYQNAIQNP